MAVVHNAVIYCVVNYAACHALLYNNIIWPWNASLIYGLVLKEVMHSLHCYEATQYFARYIYNFS